MGIIEVISIYLFVLCQPVRRRCSAMAPPPKKAGLFYRVRRSDSFIPECPEHAGQKRDFRPAPTIIDLRSPSKRHVHVLHRRPCADRRISAAWRKSPVPPERERLHVHVRATTNPAAGHPGG